MARPSSAWAEGESTLRIAPFGELSIYRPAGSIEGVVLFVSGDGGWHRGVIDMARELRAMHSLVVGIDIRRYLDSLAAPQAGCRSLAIDFESLSHRVQRELGLPEYHVPVLAGYSSGATVVYATLAQAPAGTFAGALSLGFCPDQDFRGASLCPGVDLRYSRGKDDSYVLEPATRLQEPWVALQGDRDAVCNPAATAAFAARTSGAALIPLPKVGHGFSVERNWLPQFQSAYQTLISTSQSVATATGDVADLPLTEIVAQPHSERVAILLTGDGGWAGLDRELAARLAAAGVSVVGFNSLKYYWTARTPEQSAADVARVIEHYSTAWQAREVLLIGYSFGADVLPFIVNRLSGELQRRIRAVSLLGPSRLASFEVRVADWLPGRAQGGASIAPEIARMPGLPILCLYGEGESDALCPELPADRVKVAIVGKGHHFGGDYDAIADSVLAFSAGAPTVSSAIHRRQSEMILKAAQPSI
ncbi:MAG TPA: AcvB/VirJ family lysyl-phosphatidylglycerol hydrolase [Steroidobacteraceae bacterium]|nr:AcvB/VirJ family lysyl-phosphatidylglycerol hydrolase [Steroidobacteraceae bacterium]